MSELSGKTALVGQNDEATRGRDRGFVDSPLEGSGFELPVPREISSGFETSAELRPIDPRRGGIIRAVVGLGKPIELLRRLEEPPLTVE
jgi:hypothetical protein